MTNEDTILMRIDSDLQRPFRRDLTMENLNLHNELSVKLRDRVTAFKKKKEPVLADRTKSDEGKSAAIAALATGALGDFKFLEVVATRETEACDRLRASLFTVKTPPDMDKEDAREIRAEYAGANQQEKDMTFLRTCELSTVEDPEDPDAQVRADALLWAFMTKPGLPMVTTENRDRALEDRAKQMHPATYAELQQAEIMAEQLGGLRDHVVMWLRGLGADPVKVHDQLGGEAPAPAPINVARKMVHA